MHLIILIIYTIKGIKPLKIEILKIKENFNYDIKRYKIKKNNFPPKKKNKKPINNILNMFINQRSKKNKHLPSKRNNNLRSKNLGTSKKDLMSKKSNKDLLKLETEFNINNNKKIASTTKLKNNYMVLDDFDLNNLSLTEAIKLDKRSYLQIYCSMLRRKHLIMFSFFTPNDYNLIYIKISKFVFLIGTNLAMSVLFFFDEFMHEIYINNGILNFVQQLPQIIYSSLISSFLEYITSILIISESQMHEIKNAENKKEGYLLFISDTLNCIKIKFILYFIFSFCFLVLYWYFISTFCAVYENTQIIFIENAFISFGLNLIYPFLKCLFYSLCRIIALKYKNNNKFFECMYKIGRF